MAHSIGYVTSKEALIDPAAHAAHDPAAAFFANWDPAVDNALRGGDLLCAEMSRLAYADRATVRECLRCAGFRSVEFFGGEGLLARLRFRGTEGFVARDRSGVVVLAFRGTESKRPEDLLADADFRQKPWPESPARVHASFRRCYLAVRTRVRKLVTAPGAGDAKPPQLFITGHSLGGAVATLAAADLSSLGTKVAGLVTFGSPLVGDAAFATTLAGVPARRYVDCCDLVTRVPPEKLDREHLQALLADVTGKGAPAGSFEARVLRAWTTAVGKLLRVWKNAPEYVHVGELHYANQDGVLSKGVRDEERRNDQQAARQKYPQDQGPDVVALRDLADHAPINYVSALAGRRASEPISEVPPTPAPRLYELKEVIEAEKVSIDQRRAGQKQPLLADNPTTWGLCLSGGGIRSATFGLGVLQAFAKHNLLARFDYLSTVSGGGFIGSCLTSLLSRPRGSKTREPWRYEIGLDGKTFPLTGLSPEEPDRLAADTRLHVRNQMHHLRTHSEYLMSHRGILSRDVLRAVGQICGGIAYTLTIYVLLLVLSVTLLHVLVSTLDPDLRLLEPKAAIAVKPDLEGLKYVKAFFAEAWRQRIQVPLVEIATAANLKWSGIALLAGFAWAGAWLLWLERRLERLARDGDEDFTVQRAGWSADDEREAHVVWRFNVASVLIATALTAAVSAKHTGFATSRLWHSGLALPVAFAVGGVAAMLLLVGLYETFSRHVDSRRDRRRRSLRGAMIGSAWLGLFGAAGTPLFLIAVAALGNLPFKLFEALLMLAVGYLLARKPTAKAGLFGALRLGARPVLTAVTVAFLLITIAGISQALLWAYGLSPVTAPLTALATCLAAAAVLALVGIAIDANRASPHYFYRDRLTEAYLQTTSPVLRRDGAGLEDLQQGKPVTLLRNDEDLLLRNAGVEVDGQGGRRQHGPYHLVVAALNLRGSDELNRRSFLSDHFLFSPGFVGSSVTGFARTDDYEGGQVRLARTMAISGAAVASAAGMNSFWAQSFFATLFNVRLGYWMENPWWEARRRVLGKRSPRFPFWPAYLLRELSGKTHARGKLINLSDGGHTGDNLGLLPLLERRCNFIVIADAEADAAHGFGSFMNAVRMAQVELDVEIDVDLGPIQRRKKQDEGYELSESAVAFGKIHYPERTGADGKTVTPPEGRLVYVKAAAARFAFGSEGTPLPVHVTAYLRENDTFPHQGTVDQFFDDAQFESYRALGFHVAEAAAVEVKARERTAAEEAARKAAEEKAAEAIAVTLVQSPVLEGLTAELDTPA
ncbi:MAG TPA: patatin-like phospholipase family protein [Thermoanaerobaculia bacterium]|nr:patatin-like phospholipase family protein [Thermoanaerobaculia bacterium]